MRANETERSWRKAGLLEVADLIRGVSYKRDEARSEPGSGLVPVLRANNISGAALNFTDLVYVPERCVSQEQRIRRGDIVLAMSSGSRDVVGKAAIAGDDWPGGFGAFCGVLRTRPGIDARYIARFLQSADYRRQIDSIATGTNINNLSKTTLKNIELPIAPHDIQVRLSSLLDAIEEKRSRGATAHLVAAKRAVDRFRQAVLAAACSGHLTTDWRAKNHCELVAPGPALSVKAAAHASGSPNTDALIEIPETWAWRSVEAITEKVIDYRGRTPPSQSTGPIPHVRTTQIREGRIEWATDRFVTKEIYDAYMTRGIPCRGDVLFTMEAPMGEVGVVDRDEPFSIAQRILLMRPGDAISGEFLALALRSHPVRRATEYRATGSGVLGVAYKRLRSVLIPTPPVEEQAEIVRRASQLIALADGLQKRIEAGEHRVERSSQAVLAKAFRGEFEMNGRR